MVRNDLAFCIAPLRVEDLTLKKLFQRLLSSNFVWLWEMGLRMTFGREIGTAMVEVVIFSLGTEFDHIGQLSASPGVDEPVVFIG